MRKGTAFGLVAVFFFVVLLAGIAFAGNQGDSMPMSQQALTPEQKKRLSKLSLPFIENKGQYSEEVRFYAKTFGGTVFVTRDGEVVYSLPEGKDSSKGVALKEGLIGSASKAVKGEEPSGTTVSYFKGNDPSQWKGGLNTFNVVSIGEVYKGVELKLKAYGNNVEKLFYVRPKARPNAIRLRVEGAKGIELAETGELLVKTSLGNVNFTRPIAYQEIDGRRRQIEVAYAKLSEAEYGFKLGEYDRTKELIIDPLLASTFIGGGSYDYAYALSLDSSGNVYVAGETYSSDYPTTSGAYDESYNNGDVFVSRLNPDLTSLLASTFIGGSSDDYAYALSIDSSGNVYVAGYTESSGYPTTQGAYDTSFNGIRDVFVSRLNSDLTSLLASTLIGGGSYDYAYALSLDSSGNVYVAGVAYSSNYPTTTGAYDTSYNGTCDAFVSRLNSDLTSLLASTFIGGSYTDAPFALALDSSGNVYVAGYTQSSDYPTTSGAYDTNYNGALDVFVSKLSPGLTQLSASTFIGGNNIDAAYALGLDSSGNVYVAGVTASSNYPTTPGVYDESCGTDGNCNNGIYDVFVSKLNSDLTQLSASTFIGGSSYEVTTDYAFALALDSSGNVYVAGETSSSDYPTTSGAYDESHNGYSDVFVSKLNPDLTQLLASTFIGGSSDDYAYALALDSSGNVYVAGNTGSSDYPTTTGAYDTVYNGNWDVFVSRLDSNLLSGYLLTVTKSGTGSGTVTSDPAGIDCGSDCTEAYSSGTTVTLTATADTGSTFTGWSGDADCSDGAVTMNSNVNCTATFNLNQYTITTSANPAAGGSVSCTPNPVNFGSTSTCTITTNAGYTLQDVTGTCGGTLNGSTYTTNPITADCTVQANFNQLPSQYTLAVSKIGSGTVTSNDGGISCGSDCTEDYTAGTSVTLTAAPDANWGFSGWSGDCSGCGSSATCSITMDAARTCTATFTYNPPTPTYTLSVTVQDFCNESSQPGRVYSGDGSIDCGRDCSETRTGEFSVELVAEPADGYTFMGWSGSAASCGSAARCNLGVYASMSVTAEFARVLPLPAGGIVSEIEPAMFFATCAHPIGVGLASRGNARLDLRILLSGFTEAMDLYLALYLPDIDANHLYIVKPNGDLAEFTGVNASNVWKANVTRGFWSQPLYKWYPDDLEILKLFGIYVPSGRYEFYLLAVPAGTVGIPLNYYLWHTVAVVR